MFSDEPAQSEMYGKYNVYKSGMYGTVAGRDVLQGEFNFSFFSSSSLMFKLFLWPGTFVVLQ